LFPYLVLTPAFERKNRKLIFIEYLLPVKNSTEDFSHTISFKPHSISVSIVIISFKILEENV
jgi:hypothetical protein